jgi:hypothetical protein
LRPLARFAEKEAQEMGRLSLMRAGLRFINVSAGRFWILRLKVFYGSIRAYNLETFISNLLAAPSFHLIRGVVFNVLH